MKHYVLLKLKPDTDSDAVYERVSTTFAQLAEELDFFNNPQVYRNCITRDQNSDIMGVVELDSADCLDPYLTHPLHMQMGKDLNPLLAGITSFDIN